MVDLTQATKLFDLGDEFGLKIHYSYLTFSVLKKIIFDKWKNNTIFIFAIGLWTLRTIKTKKSDLLYGFLY